MNATNPKQGNPESEGPTSLDRRPLPTRRRFWKQALLSLIIFASGAIVGTCTTLILIRQQVHHRIHHPEEMPGKIAARMQRKLDLSNEQTEQVQAILTERQQAIQQIRREFQPQLEAELNQMQEQVAHLLDDSQRMAWQAWFQDLRATWIPSAPPK